MDGFSYTNIFDTKGIEYLIIIAFLVLIIPVWILINRPLKIRAGIGETLGALSAQYSQDTPGPVLQPLSYLGLS